MLFQRAVQAFRDAVRQLEQYVRSRTWPATGPILGIAADLVRPKAELVRENALLRQQLIIARRQFKKPKLHQRERVSLVLLARFVRSWRDAVLVVKPETILRWHREGFRLVWRRRSKTASREPKLPEETAELIVRMAVENPLWGVKRIRGELLKLGINVSRRTIRKHIRRAKGPGPSGQRWATFLMNHAADIWACDFVQTYDVLFRPIFAWFVVELASRKVVGFGVTRNPTSTWVAQQLRNATPLGEGPGFIIRDRDDKYGRELDRVARGIGAHVLMTPFRSPKANAVCERFIGSVRRECLDHVIILGERHLRDVLAEYVRYFDRSRPHQGIGNRVPNGSSSHGSGPVEAVPVLGGLHHEYRRAA